MLRRTVGVLVDTTAAMAWPCAALCLGLLLARCDCGSRPGNGAGRGERQPCADDPCSLVTTQKSNAEAQ